MDENDTSIVDELRLARRTLDKLMSMPPELLAKEILTWLQQGLLEADDYLITVLADYGIDISEYRRHNRTWQQ
jgi:hypothetical protein